MRLNDPFGRLERRRESDYAAVRESLRRAGVEQIGQAERCLANMRRNALRFTGAVVLALFAALLIWPAQAGIALVVAAIVELWIVKTTHDGRRHVRRYIDEELRDRPRRE